jgi:hypothetical protein
MCSSVVKAVAMRRYPSVVTAETAMTAHLMKVAGSIPFGNFLFISV